jgi:WD40 repeat protein
VAPGGKAVAVALNDPMGKHFIRLWDVGSGKQLLPQPGHDDQVDCLALSPDGKLLASTSYGEGTLCLWDIATGRLLPRPPQPEIACRFTCFSRDGTLVASGGHDGFLHLWESATGKERRRFPIEELAPHAGLPWVDALALSPDGRRLVALTRSAGDEHSQINVWDTTDGKLLKRRPYQGSGFSSLTPDAAGVTVRTEEGMAIQETTSDTILVRIPGIVDMLPLAFSPDGKLMAALRRKALVPPAGKGRFFQPGSDVTDVSVVELATGQEVRRIESDRVNALAFSQDGRLLATSDGDAVRLWEVGTGKEIYRRQRHAALAGVPAQATVTAVSLLPGDRALATGLRDGTILVWELIPQTAAAKELSREDLNRLWSDLACDDARKAYRAVCTLAASPAWTVPYLKDRLEPVAEVDPKRVAQLIADLDSEQFTVRDAAAKELAALGERAEPALRQALKGKPSAEARKRLEGLLAAQHRVPTGEVLRVLRAIWVLERRGTVEARKVLRKLAAGAPSPQTRAAREALDRLMRRTP